MENKKNTLTVILIIIIAVLCCVIGWLIGGKVVEKDNSNTLTPGVTEESKDNLNNSIIEEENNISKDEQYKVGSLGTATTEVDACLTNFKIDGNNNVIILDNQINNKELNLEQINEKVIGLKVSTNCGCEVELAALTENGNVYVALNYSIYYESSVKFTKLNIDKKIVGLDIISFNRKQASCFQNNIVIITSDGNKYILDTNRTSEGSIKIEDFESYKKRVEG